MQVKAEVVRYEQVRYDIITAQTLKDLITRVNAFIHEGERGQLGTKEPGQWQIEGPVQIIYNGRHMEYYQTMVLMK